MPESVLDTDIFSEILKGVDVLVAQRARAYHATFGHYTISAITVMEIVKGLHKVSREERIQQFLQQLMHVRVLTWPDASLLTLSVLDSRLAEQTRWWQPLLLGMV